MPELRKDPIIGRWVIIATERAKRPDQFGHLEIGPPEDDECPFSAQMKFSEHSLWEERDIDYSSYRI